MQVPASAAPHTRVAPRVSQRIRHQTEYVSAAKPRAQQARCRNTQPTKRSNPPKTQTPDKPLSEPA